MRAAARVLQLRLEMRAPEHPPVRLAEELEALQPRTFEPSPKACTNELSIRCKIHGPPWGREGPQGCRAEIPAVDSVQFKKSPSEIVVAKAHAGNLKVLAQWVAFPRPAKWTRLIALYWQNHEPPPNVRACWFSHSSNLSRVHRDLCFRFPVSGPCRARGTRRA